ncbi:MAG: hypothetical protein ACUVX9_14595, partial [Anaerolineae bacterium]
WRELAILGGARLDRLIALLGDDPSVALETAAANAENAGRCLQEASHRLEHLRELLRASPEERRETLSALEAAIGRWKRRGQEPPAPQPPTRQSLRRLLWSGRAR